MAESKENYVKVPHWLMEYLMTADLNMTQFRIVNAIIRHTFGYQQIERWLSLEFLAELTQCDKRQVRRELNRLIEAGVIIARQEGKRRYLRINRKKTDKIEDSLDLLKGDSLDLYLEDSLDPHIKKELKKEDKEKIYTYLEKEDHVFIEIYLKHFKRNMKKQHMKVSEEQHHWILSQIEHIESNGVDIDLWEEQVRDHFKHLSPDNNGNIIPFLYASYRRFDERMFDQF
ncbi:replication protein [Paenibacillus brevis]|uniref:Replication protein n=1 Tax=Paenibacillus brevis TaxID=2841508 RepID=A0ABS6FU03_9BACL|nr:replication protein [Paenibacillus brevis]MBU5672630.1 replication protein [Paenibacillus brevis]